MKATELIESVSDKSASRDLVDGMVTRMADTHSRIRKILQNSFDKNGYLDSKVARFLAGNQKAKIKFEEYDRVLKPALYELLKRTNDIGLKNFLSDAVDEQYNLTSIENELPDILIGISRKTNNKNLEKAANVWKYEAQKTRDLVDKLTSDGTDDIDDFDEFDKPKEPSALGKQYASIEEIVNDALKRVDKKHAGEIRNIISKSDNKLLALQKELDKRGIKLSESARYKINILNSIKDIEMRLVEIALTEGERQDKAIEIFNRFLPKRTEANDKAFRRAVLDTIMQELGVNIVAASGLYNYARIKSGIPDLGRTADRAKKGLPPVVRPPNKPRQMDMFPAAKTPNDPQGDLF